jgi:asparagine synthase (glutamine-hydrolysing)
LSIIDLSEGGAQPMPRGSHLWVTFNGEIYNYLELRRELEALGHPFTSSSDTEVLLAAYQQWGTACFARFRGMWGIVLVDARRRVVVLSRDRLGIKPLYTHLRDGVLAIVSEPKQLQCLPHVTLVPDEEALREYLATGYEDSTRTFFRGVKVVPAGTFVEVALGETLPRTPVPYWHPERITPVINDVTEATAAFMGALRESVQQHLRADVPVGFALSGGLDSSAVLGLAAQQHEASSSTTKLHTFTASFPGTSIDERPWVERMVARTRAESHFVTPDPLQFLEEFDRFTWIHDEPVGHLSQYAGWCVARTTREAGVPVTMNGQGGDEVLSAYWQSYLVHLRTAARGFHVLDVARNVVGALLPGGNSELLRQMPTMLRRYTQRKKASGKVGALLSLDAGARRVFEVREQYLPRLLKWDDRNFMAFGVEGRYPFLDVNVIETALSLTPSALYRRGFTKVPLREGLRGVIPDEVRWRKSKLGFETPQDAWLRGPMRSVVERWLQEDAPVWTYIDRTLLIERAHAVWNNAPGEESGQAVFRAFSADRWLRTFFEN